MSRSETEAICDLCNTEFWHEHGKEMICPNCQSRRQHIYFRDVDSERRWFGPTGELVEIEYLKNEKHE